VVESAKGFIRELDAISFARIFFTKSFAKEKKITGFVKDEKIVSFLIPFIDRSFSREDTHG
jgi:hypothetical protein